MIKKILTAVCFSVVAAFAVVVPAFAHVVVKPSEVGVAVFQTFTVGVPNEKDSPTVALRLLIPDGLKSVTPNVKPGWKIDVKKTGDGEAAKATEIDWTSGSIPVGERDEFVFSAQVPSSEATLAWQAYQTYQDGKVVSWDQQSNANMSDDEREKMEKTGIGPYSETKVINDLKNSMQQATNATASKTNMMAKDATAGNLPLWLSGLAIVLSFTSLGMQFGKK